MADTLLFIDETTPKPYDTERQGAGGTEQTVTTVAEGLSRYFNVVVEQAGRKEESKSKASYVEIGSTKDARWIVVLRNPTSMLGARGRFPNSKIYLWSHDLATPTLGKMFEEGVFQAAGCEANICVSQWHKTQTVELLRPWGYTGQFRTRAIYNPIDQDVEYSPSDYDKNKLLWLASPHKGLDHAYYIFSYLLKQNPDFRLYVANPGYIKDLNPDKEIAHAVTMLGTLPHHEAVCHLRNSLCLFYPNVVFPETFGKVLMESNALGTPVLTHGIGATYEVLDTHPDQITNCRDLEGVIRRIMKWYGGQRPIVRGNPRFKLQNVLTEWVRVLTDVR